MDEIPAPPPRRRRWKRILLGLGIFLLLEALLPARFQPTAWVAIGALRAYQAVLSPLLHWSGARCRYQPSCSEYAVESFARHGTLRGVSESAGRLWRCSPSGRGGFDPVEP